MSKLEVCNRNAGLTSSTQKQLLNLAIVHLTSYVGYDPANWLLNLHIFCRIVLINIMP